MNAKKIRLDLDTIAITSFSTTSEESGPRGTVVAHQTLGPSCRASCAVCDDTRCGCSESCATEQTMCGACVSGGCQTEYCV
jgi:hypothetical protein